MSTATATSVPRAQDFDPSAAGPLGLIRRHPIAALLVLTFGLTWLLEIPRVLDARGELPFAFPILGRDPDGLDARAWPPSSSPSPRAAARP